MLKQLLLRLLPLRITACIRNFRILAIRYGQFRSISKRACIDADDNPIPWYTYPAIEFLKQLDFANKRIFEYGSGNSTLFWSKRALHVDSIEDDRMWYEKIKLQLPITVSYRLKENKDDYIANIKCDDALYDVVIIDGSHRFECAKEAMRKLAENGFIILDNSDWFPTTSKMLRDCGLIEVDMFGFGPINDYTWCTSFYFRRDVSFTPIDGKQPHSGIGSIRQRYPSEPEASRCEPPKNAIR